MTTTKAGASAGIRVGGSTSTVPPEFRARAEAIAREMARTMRTTWHAANADLRDLAKKHGLPGTYRIRGTSNGLDPETRDALLEFVVCWAPPPRKPEGAGQVELSMRSH